MSITINTKKECLDIILNINRDTNDRVYSKEEKYKLYLAKDFFENNIRIFSQEELAEINNNSYIINGLKSTEIEEMLDEAIRLQKSCPISLVSYFNKKISKEKKEEYLEILNKENNREQLDEFLNVEPKLVESVFSIMNNPCDYLVERMIIINEMYFNKTNHWSVDKKVNYLNENIAYLSFTNFLKYPETLNQQPEKVQNIIFEILLRQIQLEKNKNEIAKILIKCPEKFLTYMKEKDAICLKEFMDTYMEHTIINKLLSNTNYMYEANIFEQENKKIIVNGAQYLLLNRTLKSKDIIDLFEEYKELVLSQIEEPIKLYLKMANPLELTLSIENFNFFAILDNDKLSEEEKHMNIAAAFTYFCLDDKTPFLDQWSFDVMTKCDIAWFQVYRDKCKNMKLSLDQHKDLDSFLLLKNLDHSLPVSDQNNKNKLKL